MIEVSSGSVVAVDTESLRVAAARLDRASERIRDASATALEAAMMISADPDVNEQRAFDVQEIAANAAGRIAGDAGRLRHAADRYEFADLRLRWMLLASPSLFGGVGTGGRPGPLTTSEREKDLAGIRLRWQQLTRSNPEALAESDDLWREWRETAGDEAIDGWAEAADGIPVLPWTGLPLPGLGSAAGDDAKGMIAALGLGVVPAFAKLAGAGDPVSVRPMALPAGTTPPGSLQQAARRIPDGSTDARVRIETYEMLNGEREHVVYLAGTKGGGDDAWDWGSNLDLYNNRRSASFNGLEQALADAGVRPGDAVHEVGFSQGAMAAARLATEGDYDVRSLISFGSPIDVAGLDDALQVSVRHTDDVVPSLANGGAPSGGVVIEAVHDAEEGVHDIAIPAHRLKAYTETAAEVDASRDPRLDDLDALFEHLGDAGAASVVEFGVTRKR